ncbi:hypothetical protein [Streptomyces sp. A1547]|uniref:hypothetical protein n=1 Tax=Streptomyces sp. A1547 TaxID=2563105 RepID=UPI00109EB382|nr:hypothetical protein [Streptomyces sp. A1547]THA33723.1 hypothetical protein E6W17_30980 [Streptomyces sp. A1547]
MSDALVEDAVRQLAFTTNAAGKQVLAPEGLYGRRKMLALIRRTVLPEAGFGAVDRANRSLGLVVVVAATQVQPSRRLQPSRPAAKRSTLANGSTPAAHVPEHLRSDESYLDLVEEYEENA